MYNKNQWYSYTYYVKESYIMSKFLISCHSQVHHHSVFNVMVSNGIELFSLKESVKSMLLLQNFIIINLQYSVELFFMSRSLQGYHRRLLNLN